MRGGGRSGSLGDVAAIDQVVAAGDERRSIGQQEACEGRDFFGATETPDGMKAGDMLQCGFVEVLGQQGGIDETRANRGNTNALGCLFQSRGLGQPEHAMLGSHIGH